MNDAVKKPLPLHAKVSTALGREARYEGVVPVARLPRLAAALAAPTGEVEAELTLGRDANRAPRLKGHLRGRLPLVCQRCLQPFDWPLDVAIDLRLVFNEDEETRVLKDAEPFLVEDDRLPIHALVEDEALLALPFAPRCERPDCDAG